LKNTLGVIAFNQSNYQAAELAWQEALQLSLQMQAPHQSASLYNNLGKLYTQMAEWDEAARNAGASNSILSEVW
jgi:tetratricopeptide (TPR) repeat protein